jgi:dihydrolipoamide dehydrogenase
MTDAPSPYDLVVIGTGPGGYVCAIRAAQLGLKVAVVEKRGAHGGTCANVGCIPSKALLHASELYEEAGHGFDKLGIKVAPALDLPKMLAYKDETVKGNTDGVAFLFRKNTIEQHAGAGRILGPGRVAVRSGNGEAKVLATRHIVIATGSDVARLPGIEIDERSVVTSTGALALSQVPKHLLVVGAGVIGLELGSVWRRLGSRVTVVEFLDRITPGIDLEVARHLQRSLTKQGMAFRLAHKVTGVTPNGAGLTGTIEPAAGGGAPEAIEADVVLIAIGRVPYINGLGLAEVGVKLDNRARVIVDEHFTTSIPGIHAIGDVIAGPMLAHKAEEEGVALAEILAGKPGHVSYGVIPNVIYTMPEVASVGRSEEELKEAGLAYRAGKFPFLANGRAKVNRATDGFVKVLADAGTDRVLGVHIIGPQAGELIAEAALLMEFGGSAEDLARTCHAHPTLAEAMKEAALAVDKRAVHA